jgi:hypothetical protein
MGTRSLAGRRVLANLAGMIPKILTVILTLKGLNIGVNVKENKNKLQQMFSDSLLNH